MSSTRRWILGVYGAAAVVALLPAWLLLFCGESWRGRLIGLLPVLVAAWPLWAFWVRRAGWRRWASAAPGALLASSVLLVLVGTPDGNAPTGSAVRSVYLTGQSFDRWSVANIVPEADQLKFGTYFVAPVDPYIDWAQASRLRALVVQQYRATDSDPDFRALGSVMGAAYDDRDVGHVYQFVPKEQEGRSPAVLLFLHGSAGNFKAYFHLFHDFARERGMILLCPSFGFGNWQQPGGMEAIDRTYQHAVDTLGGDSTRVYLAALSNGGRGATRTWALHPDRYAGVVFISTVMEPEPIASVVGDYGGRPALVLHGAMDRRIPLGHVEHGARLLRALGANVTLRVWPEEDHFLLFSKQREIEKVMGAWMR